MKKLILASASPRRREILDMVGASFEVRVSHADEHVDGNVPPEKLPAILAERKAKTLPHRGDEIVIGADTVVLLDGNVLGKPKDEEDAIAMLRALSGKTHRVVSGISVVSDERTVTDTVVTEVDFLPLTDEAILTYVKQAHPLDKAGAYGIQEMAGAFVSAIRGDYYNVVGLPVSRLRTILAESFGIELLGYGK